MIINYGSCIVALQYNTGEMCTLTVHTSPANANIELTATGYIQIGNMIRVVRGTPVKCEVYAEGYASYGHVITVQTEEQTANITLDPGVLCTINPTPADAKVTFIIDGYTFEGDGLKELYVPINRNFTYTVSKQGYQTITETISISENSIIPVTLKELAEKPQLNVEDYEYTSDNNDNIILTKYIGTNVDVIAPELTTQ